MYLSKCLPELVNIGINYMGNADTNKTGRVLSVVIPTYNCHKLIERHIASVMEWGDLAFEIVIVDSQSTDGTLEYIKTNLKHPNIKVITRDRGLYESWNEGIAATSGDWVYISTAGDTIERTHLVHLMELGRESSVDVVISSPTFINENGSPHSDLGWPPSKIVKSYGRGSFFEADTTVVMMLSYLYCPQAVLGSSASNLYRGQHIRKRPFPVNFGGAGDTAWIMRNANETSLLFTPHIGSKFCVHDKNHTDLKVDRGFILQSLLEEKAVLIKKLGLALPNLDYLAELSLFNEANSLHRKKRAAWHGNQRFPMKFFVFFLLLVKYIFYRSLLARKHQQFKNSIILANSISRQLANSISRHTRAS